MVYPRILVRRRRNRENIFSESNWLLDSGRTQEEVFSIQYGCNTVRSSTIASLALRIVSMLAIQHISAICPTPCKFCVSSSQSCPRLVSPRCQPHLYDRVYVYYEPWRNSPLARLRSSFFNSPFRGLIFGERVSFDLNPFVKYTCSTDFK